MRITSDTPQLTVVVYRPLLVPGLCLVFFLVGLYALWQARVSPTPIAGNAQFGIAVALLLGGGGFLYSAQFSEYRFEHAARALRWRRWQAFQRRSGVIAYETIRAVHVEQGPAAEDDLYRIVLTIERGDFPLANAYTAGGDRHRAVAVRIRAGLGLEAD